MQEWHELQASLALAQERAKAKEEEDRSQPVEGWDHPCPGCGNPMPNNPGQGWVCWHCSYPE